VRARFPSTKSEGFLIYREPFLETGFRARIPGVGCRRARLLFGFGVEPRGRLAGGLVRRAAANVQSSGVRSFECQGKPALANDVFGPIRKFDSATMAAGPIPRARVTWEDFARGTRNA